MKNDNLLFRLSSMSPELHCFSNWKMAAMFIKRIWNFFPAADLNPFSGRKVQSTGAR